MGEVRADALEQQAALAQRLAHEVEVALLEVAQAAVDELARPARGAGGEVGGLHERDGEPAGRGVERGAGAVDPPPMIDVELLVGEAGQPAARRCSGSSFRRSCPASFHRSRRGSTA